MILFLFPDPGAVEQDNLMGASVKVATFWQIERAHFVRRRTNTAAECRGYIAGIPVTLCV